MTTNPFAALLDGVPRYENTRAGDLEECADGSLVGYDAVLAALAAAVPDDLAEAGKVLERLKDEAITLSGIGINRGSVDASLSAQAADEAADLITALLASIAAQEVRIKGLEAERNAAVRREETAWREANHANAKVRGWEATVVVRNLPQLSIPVTGWGPGEGEQTAIPHITPERLTDILDKLDATETALAAEKAKVAKLVEALVWCSGSDDFQDGGKAREGWLKMCAPLLCAALTEAGQ